MSTIVNSLKFIGGIAIITVSLSFHDVPPCYEVTHRGFLIPTTFGNPAAEPYAGGQFYIGRFLLSEQGFYCEENTSLECHFVWKEGRWHRCSGELVLSDE